MININLGGANRIPLYQQIVEQIKQHVAMGNLQPNEHLPSIRQLAQSLQINPGTVSRAYSELEQQGVVMSRYGGGTIVSTKADDSRIVMLHQKHLSDMVSNNILNILSLGYTLEELEGILPMHLARWHRDRQKLTKKTGATTISIVGSDDMALSLLINQLKHKHPEIIVQLSCSGSLGGIIALQRDEADLAGIHLLDEETGEYNYPYVKHILPGVRMVIIHLAYRAQGLLLPMGNPRQIKKLEDLRRPDITMVNRQKGSGTRVLLDLKLRELGIQPDQIQGYHSELDTHLAVAAEVAEGQVDVGLGIEAVAHNFNLEFIPLFRERYDIVMSAEKYKTQPITYLIEIIKSQKFKKLVAEIGGYGTSETGNTRFL